jgi:hypothetical protein
MKHAVRISLPAAMFAVVLLLSGGTAMAKGGDGGGGGGGGGASGTWPTQFPLPTNPGTLISQTATKAVVRSTDVVFVVRSKLDDLYVTQKGCTERLAVNKPKDYLCANAATGKTDEVYFTFAALDPTPTDSSRSQTNAFFVKG